jgi:regulator of sirC expression with transglutaminase-like and TPR domain
LHQEFRRAVDRPEEEIDLGRAALTIAAGAYPGLDVGAYVARIDRLAGCVSERLDAQSGTYDRVAALNSVLFLKEGFRGNRDDYFDPKNSFLNEVIERKTGIPITLSVLYMEVAERTGLHLEGVSFPGHFLVKYVGEAEEIVIDPFNGGEIVAQEKLARMLFALSGGKIAFHPDLLQPATKKQVLKRMLHNLKLIYLTGDDPAKALSAADRLVILDPASAKEIRDRGMIYLKLECFKSALEDLEHYLRLAPQAGDRAEVREQIVDLAKRVSQIH